MNIVLDVHDSKEQSQDPIYSLNPMNTIWVFVFDENKHVIKLFQSYFCISIQTPIEQLFIRWKKVSKKIEILILLKKS